MGKKEGLNLANRITILRIILIPFFVAAVVYSHLEIALVIFIIAVISDAADGFIARALKQKTALGTILDPVADKLLLLSAYICLSVAGSIPADLKLPPYVPIIVISRDVIIVLGSVMVYVVTNNLKISPSSIGKITTFFQMITILSILLQFKYSFLIWNLTVLFTIISGIDYVIKGSRLFGENHSQLKKAA
ncbi:MAG: CDP-alcohol phosphatidyltransferase family protein [Candidatus Omnitrophota bacterium]